MSKIKQAWGLIIDKLERGDLIPLLILVSAGHYITVLREFDHEVTAVAVGILVDLGHFRSVRIAARYRYRKGSDDQKPVGRRSEFVLRWFVVIVLTVIALSYHLRFYAQDWTLAAPIPILIAFLAYCDARNPQQKRSDDERSAQLEQNLRRAKSTIAQLEQSLEQAGAVDVQLPALVDGDYARFTQICAGINGNLGKMTGSQLNIMAVQGGILPKSESTIKTWRDRFILERA